MNDLERAKISLKAGGYTCVLVRDGNECVSTERGVKPLVCWVKSGADFYGYCAADKVVGRATAFLYAIMGVRAVYADVISRSALEVLQKYRIEVEYALLVEHIINRAGDGICPFERTVLAIDDKAAAYQAILHEMAQLNIK